VLGKVIYMASRFRAKAVQFAFAAFLLVSSSVASADESRAAKKSEMAFAVIEIPPYGYLSRGNPDQKTTELYG
jgi:hypothetical protein